MCGGVVYSDLPTPEVLWDRYFTEAPERQRQCVERWQPGTEAAAVGDEGIGIVGAQAADGLDVVSVLPGVEMD